MYDNEEAEVREELSADVLSLLRNMGLVSAPRDIDRMENGDPVRAEGTVEDMEATEPGLACGVLVRDGVVRVNNVLSSASCLACSSDIDASLAVAVAAGSDHYVPDRSTGFGNVDASGLRWDMYLDGEADPHAAALTELLGLSTPLDVLFEALFQGRDAAVHEFASLISDGGAESQRVHSDTMWQASGCSTFTCFVALQDITTDMGPTHFIRGSHTQDAHQRLRHTRDDFLADSLYCRAGLKRGDAVVMDSRLCHTGAANVSNVAGISQRRTLLYFTLLNPDFEFGPGEGSKLDRLDLHLHKIRDGIPTVSSAPVVVGMVPLLPIPSLDVAL